MRFSEGVGAVSEDKQFVRIWEGYGRSPVVVIHLVRCVTTLVRSVYGKNSAR